MSIFAAFIGCGVLIAAYLTLFFAKSKIQAIVGLGSIGVVGLLIIVLMMVKQ